MEDRIVQTKLMRLFRPSNGQDFLTGLNLRYGALFRPYSLSFAGRRKRFTFEVPFYANHQFYSHLGHEKAHPPDGALHEIS